LLVTFIIPIEGSTREFIIGHTHTIAHAAVDWEEEKVTDVKPLHNIDQHRNTSDTMVNDAKCSPSGRLWFGTMGMPISVGVVEPGLGSMYRMDQRGVERVVENISLSNGFAFNSDRKILYFIDSLSTDIAAFDYSEDTGDLSNRRSALNKEKAGLTGKLDGMTIDTRGNLWVAVFGEGKIIEVDPSERRIVRNIGFEKANFITSCVFGGPELNELYVTSARLEGDPEKVLPEAGSIFRVTGLGDGVRGLPAVGFPRNTLETLLEN